MRYVVRAFYNVRRVFTLLICVLVIGFAADVWAAEDPPHTHNMLLIGQTAAFVSHLPMFDALSADNSNYTSPHRFQVILEVLINRADKNLLDQYGKDRRDHPNTKTYTIGPDPFVLSRLFGSHDLHPPIGAFMGKVYRGHLEKGGEAILPSSDNPREVVVLDVKKIIHARQFDPNGEKPENLTYLLFGTKDELYIAHFITKPPDFDQFLSVTVQGHQFSEEELSRGVTVSISGRKNISSKRLQSTDELPAEAFIAGTNNALPLRILGGVEYYFEEGELQIPPTFDTTDQERKAGFP